MSRWMIEKDGTGIEKSGTGIEKSGTGIEKSGTGIEKSGTGIEKSGTGIRRILLACSIALITFAGNIQAGNISPAGSLQLVVQDNTIAASWIIGDSVFSGVSSMNGSFASMMLTEIALAKPSMNTNIAGSGSGSAKHIAGSGSGSAKQIAGSGSGSAAQIAGSGSGSAAQIAGSGSGSAAQIAGSGSGSAAQIAGSGSGSQILIAGSGSGRQGIFVTLPDGTGMAMEVAMGCGSASVSVVDSNSVPIATFNNVKVLGKAEFCSSDFGGGFQRNPGGDFRLER